MNPYLQKLQKGPNSSKRNFGRARVEIIPLIDVMFLLVAFFMVVSMSLVMQKGIFVDLAPAHTADSSMEEQDTLVISVDDTGEFFLNKDKITLKDLSVFLLKKAKIDPETSIVIKADRQARHEDVVKALDLVRKSKLHKVIFSVEPKQ